MYFSYYSDIIDFIFHLFSSEFLPLIRDNIYIYRVVHEMS